MVRLTERIGVLGGTFDPPHIGHLALAEYARDGLGLGRVLFVPAADPPHKRGITRIDVEHRVAMVERAVENNPHFIVSRVDVDRPGPHYTVDLMRILRDQHQNAEFYFVMGGDSLRDLPRWHQPDDLLELCKLAVMQRAGMQRLPRNLHAERFPTLRERMVMIDASLLDLSSSMIVRRLRLGQTVRYLLPDRVIEYIQEHGLYRQ